MPHSEEISQSKDLQETEVPSLKKASAAKCQPRDNGIPPAWRLTANIKNTAATAMNLLDIRETCGILSEDEIAITSKNEAVDIVDGIRCGNYSTETVVTAFCKRAAIAQQLVCLSSYLILMLLVICPAGQLLDRGFL